MRSVRLLSVVALVVAGLAALPSTPATGDDIAEVRAQAQAATQELADAESRLGRIEQEISTARHQAQEAEREIAGLRDQVNELAVQQYVRPDEIFVLDGEDLNEQVRADALARIVSRGDADALDRYLGAQDDLESAAARLAELQAEQEAAIADLEERQEALEAELARLQELERQRRAAEERARREAAAAAAAEAAAEEEAAAATTPPSTTSGGDSGGGGGGGSTPPPSSGGMTCPVPGSTFVDTWGAPRSGGRSHQGVDMMAGYGTPIYAPVSGNVSFMGVSIGGLSFYVYGDNGNTYFGTHLQGYEGGNRRVSAGELIGYVGDTGNAAGTPHLHFEIHPGGGSPVNPYPATAAACF